MVPTAHHGGRAASVRIRPKFFDKNECDNYKINHMLSLWKNLERSWAGLSYDAKSSTMVGCY